MDLEVREWCFLVFNNARGRLGVRSLRGRDDILSDQWRVLVDQHLLVVAFLARHRNTVHVQDVVTPYWFLGGRVQERSHDLLE